MEAAKDTPLAPQIDLLNPDRDEEIYGEVYDGGVPISVSNYYVMLRPDLATRQRISSLGYADFDSVMWVKPDKHNMRMWGWIDIRSHTGGCENWRTEGHWRSPSGPLSGRERHCITAGRYVLSLWDGSPEGGNGTLIREIEVEHLQIHPNARARNTAAGNRRDVMERGGPVESYSYVDLIVPLDVDSTAPSRYTATPVLRIDDTAGPSVGLEDSVFISASSPAGTKWDYFRFDVSGSTFTGPLSWPQEPLARIWYDAEGNPEAASGYFDSWEQGNVLKSVTYERIADLPGNYSVAMDLLSPDDSARRAVDGPSGAAARDTILIESGTKPSLLNAYFSVERSTNIWRMTDQVVDASESTAAPGAQYRWTVSQDAWTPWSSEPTWDFAGHDEAGSRSLTLEVENPSGERDTYTRMFTVDSQKIELTGPTYITAKRSYVYRSNVEEDWYDRAGVQEWRHRELAHDSLIRIWAAGQYSAGIRQEGREHGSFGDFRRGRLDIDVCIGTGCSGCSLCAIAPAMGTPAALPGSTFGAGPVLLENDRVHILYDLTGVLSAGSDFHSASWLLSPIGSHHETALEGGSKIAWTVLRRDSTATEVRFDLIAFRDTPTFGFAWDPDVGADPADDRTGYSAAHRVVYAYDGSGAVGLMIAGDDRAHDLTVRQFGARRQPPARVRDIVETMENGSALDTRAGDAQFMVSAVGAGSSVTVWFLQAPDVAGLMGVARSVRKHLE